MKNNSILLFTINILIYHKAHSSSRITSTNDHENQHNRIKNHKRDDNDSSSVKKRIQCAKYKLWQRGAFALDENMLFEGEEISFKAGQLEEYALKLGPVRKSRKGQDRFCSLRGGFQEVEETIEDLKSQFGTEFSLAIEKVSVNYSVFDDKMT